MSGRTPPAPAARPPGGQADGSLHGSHPLQHNDGCSGPGAVAGVGGNRPRPAQPGGCKSPGYGCGSGSLTHLSTASCSRSGVWCDAILR